jgi:hypothetical protein
MFITKRNIGEFEEGWSIEQEEVTRGEAKVQ